MIESQIMKSKPDWSSIRKTYIEDDIPLRRLATECGVLFTTLSKRAGREDWHRLRSEFRAVDTHKLATSPRIEPPPAKTRACEDTVFEKMLGHLQTLGNRLEGEFEKAATAELTPGGLKTIGELGKVLRSLVTALSDLRNASSGGRLGQRRLIRPEIMEQARSSEATALAPTLPNADANR